MDDVPAINPKQAVLLVMDYQPGIVDSLPNIQELLNSLEKVIALARENGMKVGYVRVAFDEEDCKNVPETNKMFKSLLAGKNMDADAAHTQVHGRIGPQPGDIEVRKVRVGAFSTTDLDKELKDNDIETLIMAGVSTSGVVLSTVCDAADRDYRMYVLKDLCADPDPEVHKILTEKVFLRRAYVITSANLSDLLEKV